MPNYNERRYQAEKNRRDADDLRRRYGDHPQALAVRRDLMMEADALEQQNERDEMRYYGQAGMDYDGGMEMRRGVPGSGRGRIRMENVQDYPRSEYEQPEMARRRRDSRGRYMTYGNGGEAIYPEYERPYMPYMGRHGGMGKNQQKIGFASGGDGKSSDMFEEMEEYWNDYMKHKQLYEQTKSPEEKEHMKLELEELAEYVGDFLKKLQKKANTPEEAQIMRGMMQKIQQQNKAGGQTF